VKSKRIVTPVLLAGLLTLWAAPAFAATAVEGLPTVVSPSVLADRLAAAPGSIALLDARPAEAFNAGHIPGAKSRFWKKDIVPEGQPNAGSFRPEADVKAELESAGVTATTPVIVYCNTGQQASELFYTLRYRLGYSNVRLYNGSWLEWSITPGLPKEATPPPA